MSMACRTVQKQQFCFVISRPLNAVSLFSNTYAVMHTVLLYFNIKITRNVHILGNTEIPTSEDFTMIDH
jgi:hypothetical protein